VKIYYQNTSNESLARFDFHDSVQIDMKKQNNKVVDHLLETRIPNIWGLIIKGVDNFRNEKPFDLQMQIFFKDVIPKKLHQLCLHAGGNYREKFSDKNVSQLCKALKEKSIDEYLLLEGFEFTDAQFNEIIRSASELHSLYIMNNTVKPHMAEPDEQGEIKVNINLKPLFNSKTLSVLDISGNTWGDEIDHVLQEQMSSSKCGKKLKSLKIAIEKDEPKVDDRIFDLETRQ
jgi:hypothetical protein